MPPSLTRLHRRVASEPESITVNQIDFYMKERENNEEDGKRFYTPIELTKPLRKRLFTMKCAQIIAGTDFLISSSGRLPLLLNWQQKPFEDELKHGTGSCFSSSLCSGLIGR